MGCIYWMQKKRKGGECNLPGKRSDLPPIEILAGENGFPFLNELIPGTGYTFQQLRDAMAPNSMGAREAGARSCMAVHRVMSNLTNGGLVYQIIDEFARNNPLWAEHSRRATAREIIQLLMDYLLNGQKGLHLYIEIRLLLEQLFKQHPVLLEMGK